MMRAMPSVARVEYPVYNLWIQRPFEFEGYAFTPAGGMDGYQERVREMLATPEDCHTVDVVRDTAASKFAPLSCLGNSGDAIEDYLLLLSLGQGRNVHYREARFTNDEGEVEVSHSYTGRALARGEQAISPFEVEDYLSTAMHRLRLPGWVEDRGFTSGAFWYLESLAAPNLEVRFVSAWNGMMAIVHRYFQGKWEGTGEASSPSLLFLAFRDAHECDFVMDEHPEIWEELSKDFLRRHPNTRLFSARHASLYTRKLQLVLLLVLLDLAGTTEFARRESVLKDIRR